MTETVKAVLLGIVEGLTEFIPVSSTGHLILAGDLLEFHGGLAATFEIFIQLGAILAVVVLYPNRFLNLLRFKEESDGFSGREGIQKLFVACLPAFVLGFLLHGFIKATLFSPLTVALALLVGGVVMIFIERIINTPTVSSIEKITYRQAFLIGCFQCISLWPGMSRSASTIVGGLILGLERKVAAEFSFIVAVPVMFAAVGYDMLKSYSQLDFGDLQVFAVGFVVSFIVAILAIKFFISLLARFTLAPFGWYRVGIGILALAFAL